MNAPHREIVDGLLAFQGERVGFGDFSQEAPLFRPILFILALTLFGVLLPACELLVELFLLFARILI